MKKTLLYISSVVPRKGTGSWIVIQRHLQRLEASGWYILLCVPQQSVPVNYLPSSWETIVIPMRKWWWPPVKSYIPGSPELRLFLWRLECKAALKDRVPNSILTILGDQYASLAGYVSKEWNIPLTVIIHDDLKLREERRHRYAKLVKDEQRVLKRADRAWLVSPEMKRSFHFSQSTKVSVLLPTPEGSSQAFVNWNQNFERVPVVAHAGSFHKFHVPYFRTIAKSLLRFNGIFLIVAERNNPALPLLLQGNSNIRIQEPFEENKDVLTFLRQNATSILVTYPFGLKQYPWTATSFPSRMVEFMHLGLPLLILASPGTALANWAIDNQWLSYFGQSDGDLEEDQLLPFFEALTRKDDWLSMAKRSQQIALGEFDAERIQNQFESELATVP